MANNSTIYDKSSVAISIHGKPKPFQSIEYRKQDDLQHAEYLFASILKFH